jgi:spermidine synthase
MKNQVNALLITAFVISTCGLVYELIAGTAASYLLGDSVTQFSTVIGVYLFSMGIGSYLSKYVDENVVGTFVRVELLVGLVGGTSAAALFTLFEHVGSFRILLYSLVSIIGVLIGLEVPLLMRILKERLEFKELVSQVFTFDYVGGLIASLLFPLVLVPYLGLVRACFLFGLLNIAVAVWTLHIFKSELTWYRTMLSGALAVAVVLVCGFVYSEKLMTWGESASFPDPIIFSRTTPYQRILITSNGKDMRLFLNGNLQFSSRDEYRYHEALVHPALSALTEPKSVLVLGGGDGMAVRELLKYPGIRSITLVDLDKEMTALFRSQSFLTHLNNNSLNDPRVHLITSDAFVWLRATNQRFDAAIVDFPDPSNFSLGKLYSQTFYKTLRSVLNDGGLVVVQSTSPYFAKNSFWCVVDTLASAGFHTTPYHAYVPSFGEWGYVIGSLTPYNVPAHFPEHLRFVTPATVAQMLSFAPDMLPTMHTINRLNNQSLVHLFESEWGDYVETH